MTSFRTFAIVLSLSIVVCGCGQGGPETVRVSGTASYAGGAWPADTRLYFQPEGAAPGQNHPGVAVIGKDGSFQAVSFNAVNGLVPGKYKVTVECWKSPPMPDKAVGATSFVPAAYTGAATSPLALTVESGKPQSDVRFDVPAR